MKEPLPSLLDCKGISTELNVPRATATRIMRHVPTLKIPGMRKTFARRADVEKFIEEHLQEKGKAA